MTWEPEYAQPQVITLHHTVTQNSAPDPALRVRLIYHQHAVTQGWGDIGYNYLVDHLGNIYEGRTGGDGVIGAHVLGHNRGNIGIAFLGTFVDEPPTQAALDAARALITDLCDRFDIDQDGGTLFMGEVHDNVSGHRDYMATQCPGEQLYDLLPYLRGT